jgi:hypothetical protein
MGSTKTRAILALAVAVAASIPAAASKVVNDRDIGPDLTGIDPTPPTAADVAAARRRDDFSAMQKYRPGYPFWQHVFTLPDQSIAFGSATEVVCSRCFQPRRVDSVTQRGRTRRWRTFSMVSNWRARSAIAVSRWRRSSSVPRDRFFRTRRAVIALLPNARRYGAFPRRHGGRFTNASVSRPTSASAQVILESGLSAQRRSEANAIGFCQWLHQNWKTPEPFLADTHRRQEPDDAGTVLCGVSVGRRTKYGSFIPALSSTTLAEPTSVAR